MLEKASCGATVLETWLMGGMVRISMFDGASEFTDACGSVPRCLTSALAAASAARAATASADRLRSKPSSAEEAARWKGCSLPSPVPCDLILSSMALCTIARTSPLWYTASSSVFCVMAPNAFHCSLLMVGSSSVMKNFITLSLSRSLSPSEANAYRSSPLSSVPSLFSSNFSKKSARCFACALSSFWMRLRAVVIMERKTRRKEDASE
mmetsp:Transcript_40588/g.95330  ORF Transcript_40588/g.95330 Transcript_40588/m.95330 type:complete len:209 (+) Transcript_40588:765-1391(+)